MKKSPFFLTALITLAAPFSLSAVTLFWDSNGAAMSGAGSAPSGTWGTDAFWSEDPNGDSATGPWVSGSTAVFSGGTDATNPYTITLNGVQTVDGLFVQEGAVTLAGSALAVGISTIEISAGAKLSIPVTTSITASSGANLNLEGGTMRSTVNGVGLSFISSNFNINIGALGGTVETANTGTNSTIFGTSTVGSLTGAIKGPRNTLIKTGSGEFRYQGVGLPNTTFAKLVVNQGLFRLGFSASIQDERGFGAVPAAFTPDAITLSNGGSIGTSFTAANSVLHVNRGVTLGVGGGAINGSMTIPGAITGPGSLSHLTTGTVVLSGNSDYAGSTFINLGIVTASNANALGTTAGDTQVLAGAELRIDGAASTFTINEPIQIAGGGGGGGGAITIQNASAPTIAGPVTLTGDATVTVSSSASGTFSNPAAFTSLSNQNLTLSGGTNATGVKAITGVINLGSGGLTKIQGGTWILTAANTYSGPTTISAGTLQLGNGLTGNDGTISNSPSIANNGTLAFNRFGSNAYSGPISGSGIVTKAGAGTQTLSGANSYTGTTTITGGTLKLGNASALGFGGIQTTSTGTTVVSSGFSLDLNGTGSINEPITLNGTGVSASGALINSSATPATIGSGIAGAQVAAITGTGSSYSSAPTVTISGTGTLATATASLGVTTASFAIAGGTTIYSAAPTVTISGNAGNTATATAILTAGVVSAINVTNAGTGFTTAPTITFSGGTVTTAGINPTGTGSATEFTVSGITVTAPGSGYTGTPTYTFGSGNATPGTVTRSSVTLAADSSIGGTGDIAINSAISESGGARTLTKIGTGTLTISGPQSYTTLLANEGRTTLNSSLSNATITDAAGAILNVNANASGSTVNVSGNTVFTVSQNLAALNIGTGGVVTVGLPAQADAPEMFTASDALLDAAGNTVQAVPEPGSLVLIALGALGLLGRRRSIK